MLGMIIWLLIRISMLGLNFLVGLRIGGILRSLGLFLEVSTAHRMANF